MLLFTTNASSICLQSSWTYLEAVPGHATRHALHFQQSRMQCNVPAAMATIGVATFSVVVTGAALTGAAITSSCHY